jgi:EAL domain-containing protein (putative c-di-GMP-specific phosphodiesterase class I)
VLITDFEEARWTLGKLRDLGIAIALDDFGTGYSSLSYLRRLPLDAIKIDQSFVHEIDEATHDTAVIKAIVAMADSLKLQVIAEGVESGHQARVLRELGCEVLQGFLYGQAMPAERFGQLIAAQLG